jgi:hypothetical protein
MKPNPDRTSLALTASFAFVFACGVAGCQHDTTTTFPAGLQPLTGDTEAPPAADGGNAYPEELALTQGHDDTGNFDYVFATAYVDAPIETVWSAFKDPDVVVDRHNIDSYTVTKNVEKGYDVSFLTTYSKKAGPYNVTFDLTWREGVVEGTESNPSGVSVVYEKTHGSSFIDMMKGSIQLTSVNPNVTELQFVQRMNAMSTDSSNIALWTNALFASVVAQVHGKPLP